MMSLKLLVRRPTIIVIIELHTYYYMFLIFYLNYNKN